MKKLLLIIASILMLTTANIKAQVNFEKKYPFNSIIGGLRIVNLGNSNYKYELIDYNNSQFSLYNLDHTPFILNISVPLLNDTSVYEIGYITSTLWDCDSTNIEYVVTTSFVSPNRTFYVYRTDGTLIFSKDSATIAYCYGCIGQEIKGIVNTPSGTKLTLLNSNNDYFVYGLCGTLPENIEEMEQSTSYVKVFPNPTSKQVNFQVIPPSNYEKYELTILNSAFQTIKTTSINGETKIYLDSESLSSGTYFYTLSNKNKVFQTGKFVFTK